MTRTCDQPLYRSAPAALLLLLACRTAGEIHAPPDPGALPAPEATGRTPRRSAPRNGLERSTVQVVVSGQDYDFAQPWAKLRPYTSWLTGVVVEGPRVLVASGRLGNATSVEVLKDGLPRRYAAQIERADFELPLVLIKVDDPSFFEGLAPAPLAGEVPKGAEVTIYRWLATGQLEDARGKVRQLRVEDHWPGRVQLLTLDVNSSIDGAGASEVLSLDGEVAGLATSKAENKVAAIAGPVLASFLAAAREPAYRGVARGGYNWQALTNPALRRALGLGPEEGGIRVTAVLPHGSLAGAVQPDDVILEIAGQPVDNVGQYNHPRYGRLPASVLFTESARPGDTIELKVLRGGERRTVAARLKRMSPEEDKIPPYLFGRAPDYFAAGGLVFQHLTRPFLQIWKDWWKRAPLRLLIAHDEEGSRPSPESPRLVVLTRVLADPCNVGYHDLGAMIVTQVNGVPVKTLDDVRAAFARPERGFHIIDFLAGQGPRRIVLDAKEVAEAEPRIRARYGVEEAPR